MKSPEIEKRMRDNGLDVDATSPEQFAAQIRKDLERWPGIVKARGIKANRSPDRSGGDETDADDPG